MELKGEVIADLPRQPGSHFPPLRIPQKHDDGVFTQILSPPFSIHHDFIVII